MWPLRLRQMSGYEGRVNDILFQPATRSGSQGRETLVFFGGDVQDYPEIMQVHRDNRNYLKWNLESTARMLGNSFPNKHIFVVRPSRIEYKSFSCYDNFVCSNSAGVPEHAPGRLALRHLQQLLQNVSNRLKAMPASELLEASTSAPEYSDVEELHGASGGVGPPDADPLWWRESLALDGGSLSLVGFSKGCVVLNQIVYEFHYAQTLTPGDEHMTRMCARVRELYWLDGGHAGGRGAWVTAPPLLRALARADVKIYVHVSPYQVEDESRPWIGREERIFTSSLRELGAEVLRYAHAASGAPSLHSHFAVLGSFRRLQDSAPQE